MAMVQGSGYGVGGVAIVLCPPGPLNVDFELAPLELEECCIAEEWQHEVQGYYLSDSWKGDVTIPNLSNLVFLNTENCQAQQEPKYPPVLLPLAVR